MSIHFDETAALLGLMVAQKTGVSGYLIAAAWLLPLFNEMLEKVLP